MCTSGSSGSSVFEDFEGCEGCVKSGRFVWFAGFSCSIRSVRQWSCSRFLLRVSLFENTRSTVARSTVAGGAESLRARLCVGSVSLRGVVFDVVFVFGVVVFVSTFHVSAPFFDDFPVVFEVVVDSNLDIDRPRVNTKLRLRGPTIEYVRRV